MKEKPEKAVELAVYGMLPKNRLRDRFMRRLKVTRAAEGAATYKGAVPVDMKNPKLRSGGPFVAASPKA
jgi:ribosomal protein L13